MALSMTAVIAEIRDIVAEVTGLERVYAPSETDENRLPLALNELPCALVLPGEMVAYILMSGGHRHTYAVTIEIFEAPGGDIGTAASVVLPMVDRLIEKFVGNVMLANAGETSCVFKSHSAFSRMEYGSGDYVGMRITVEASERASATPTIGT